MFYERLYEALEILVDFFHADQKGLPLESIKSGETDCYQKLTTHIHNLNYTLLVILVIIIIIINWHYNPLSVFTFSARSLQVLQSLAVSFQVLFSAFVNLP